MAGHRGCSVGPAVVLASLKCALAKDPDPPTQTNKSRTHIPHAGMQLWFYDKRHLHLLVRRACGAVLYTDCLRHRRFCQLHSGECLAQHVMSCPQIQAVEYRVPIVAAQPGCPPDLQHQCIKSSSPITHPPTHPPGRLLVTNRWRNRDLVLQPGRPPDVRHQRNRHAVGWHLHVHDAAGTHRGGVHPWLFPGQQWQRRQLRGVVSG